MSIAEFWKNRKIVIKNYLSLISFGWPRISFLTFLTVTKGISEPQELIMSGKIDVGDRAPHFTLTNHTGDKVTLNEVFKGNKAVVLAFYVLDFTGDEKAG